MINIEKMQKKLISKINKINQPFSIIEIDIDFLIRYCVRLPKNDIDKIVKNIKKFLLDEYKNHKIIYKKKCDEFFIICNDFDNKKSAEFTNAGLKKFRKQRFASFKGGEYENLRITFSAGVASYPENGGKDKISKKAFTALLAAKAMRRNNVKYYEESHEINPERILFNNDLIIEPVAGRWGEAGRTANKTNADSAFLWEPQAIASGEDGKLYIADHNNHQIISYDGKSVTPVFGDGKYGGISQNRLNKPTGLYVYNNKLYITDTGNDIVITLDLTCSTAEVLCGTGYAGYSGDLGPAKQAELNKPGGIVVDARQNIYINDIANNRIRMIDKNGVIKTFAGDGRFGFKGDKCGALAARFNEIYGICIDGKGENIYAADYFNHRIRRIDIKTEIITTVAGNGVPGYSGDGGDPTEASLNRPAAVCADNHGNIFIAESGNHSVRVILNRENKIYTLAGGLGMGTGIHEKINDFKFANPNSLCIFDNCLYILDGANNRICKINLSEVIK